MMSVQVGESGICIERLLRKIDAGNDYERLPAFRPELPCIVDRVAIAKAQKVRKAGRARKGQIALQKRETWPLFLRVREGFRGLFDRHKGRFRPLPTHNLEFLVLELFGRDEELLELFLDRPGQFSHVR